MKKYVCFLCVSKSIIPPSLTLRSGFFTMATSQSLHTWQNQTKKVLPSFVTVCLRSKSLHLLFAVRLFGLVLDFRAFFKLPFNFWTTGKHQSVVISWQTFLKQHVSPFMFHSCTQSFEGCRTKLIFLKQKLFKHDCLLKQYECPNTIHFYLEKQWTEPVLTTYKAQTQFCTWERRMRVHLDNLSHLSLCYVCSLLISWF